MFILQKKGIFFYLNTPSAPPHLWGGGGNGQLGGGAIFQIGGALGGPHLPRTLVHKKVGGLHAKILLRPSYHQQMLNSFWSSRELFRVVIIFCLFLKNVNVP